MQRFKIVELACDPPGWRTETEHWADTYGSVVVSNYRTNQRKFMAEGCARLHAAVTNRQVTHDGDPRLARHIHNAVVKETSEGAYITKEHRHSSRKIDLATAAVIAHDRASENKPGQSIYETRGVLVFTFDN
jgi:phage terminase large subunit-like protein